MAVEKEFTMQIKRLSGIGYQALSSSFIAVEGLLLQQTEAIVIARSSLAGTLLQ